ncbi:glycoside hydrolase family 13 protein [Atopococcus tabaci]|uniref:glycoside hydrolase family 13 protein n=1 Tax=Atopococcus tabaci TaxID=269774 RepID=UPI00040BB75D|nr:glycoside hydrolase family 13 protein [Atopococcus tabaci]
MDTAALYHRPESEYAYLYENNRVHIRLRTKIGDVAQVNLISGDPYAMHKEKWYYKGKEMRKIANTNTHDYWQIETTEETSRMSYAFHVIGKDGVEVFYGDQGVYPYQELYYQQPNFYFRMPYFHDIDRFDAPSWVKETVWYQIFPDRFANGDPSNDPEGVLPWGVKKHPGREDFYGGDLQGVLDNLDYLEELGVNGLYFMPIFTAYSNHKYDTIDYKEIDPQLGDKKLFKKLVEEAHERGMRIMLDAVFNHIGIHSPQWQDVLKHQENSRYKDWFHIHSFPVHSYEDLDMDEIENVGRLNYDTFAFTGHMPKLNTANPEVQEYLLDIATYWVREFDIDAWRLDVANEVDHHFWKKFNSACVELKKDFYILGEVWHSSQTWLQGDEFHGVMNYAFVENIENYFLKRIILPSQMASGLNNQLLLYRKQTNEVMFNLLDSHDTSRLLTKAHGNKDLAKSALAFMFAQPGSPCIFYGTEVGLEGFDDPDCRKCMIWDEEEQDRDMLAFIKELIQFRKTYQPVLTHGMLQWHDIRDEEWMVGFKRVLGNDQMVFYFNNDEEATVIEMPENAKPVLSYLSQEEEGNVTIQHNGFFVYYLDEDIEEQAKRLARKKERARQLIRENREKNAGTWSSQA